MENGVYIVERSQHDMLREQGVEIPRPWVGVIDLQRIMEGKLSEPPRRQPLGVLGLESLLQATGDDARAVMMRLCRKLYAAQEYFAWSDVPVVFLVDGNLTQPAHTEAVTLTVGEQSWDLTPLTKHRLVPMKNGIRGWYGSLSGAAAHDNQDGNDGENHCQR